MKIILKDLKPKDLFTYRKLIAPSQAFHRLNGPYFGLPTEADQDQKVKELDSSLKHADASLPMMLIMDASNTRILGEVSFYWRDKRTLWLEVGIVIFDQSDWGKGIGKLALPLWIDTLFVSMPELVRVGLTTWSGNPGMIALAEHIGLVREACFRKARILNGQHFDSLSYGVLREEWETLRASSLSSATDGPFGRVPT